MKEVPLSEGHGMHALDTGSMKSTPSLHGGGGGGTAGGEGGGGQSSLRPAGSPTLYQFHSSAGQLHKVALSWQNCAYSSG